MNTVVSWCSYRALEIKDAARCGVALGSLFIILSMKKIVSCLGMEEGSVSPAEAARYRAAYVVVLGISAFLALVWYLLGMPF